MQCSYFDAGVCRSCEFMGQPYEAQLAGKVSTARAVLAEASGADVAEWLPPAASREDGFRNKAKLVISLFQIVGSFDVVFVVGAFGDALEGRVVA